MSQTHRIHGQQNEASPHLTESTIQQERKAMKSTTAINLISIQSKEE